MKSGSNLSEAFVRQFERKNFRDTFVAEMLSSRLAKMIRSLREQRGWSQKQLAEALGTTQSAVSRIESAQYGKVTVATLLAVAAAFDLPLSIDMPEWTDWFGRVRDSSKQSFMRQGFDVDLITGTSSAPPLKEDSSSSETITMPLSQMFALGRASSTPYVRLPSEHRVMHSGPGLCLFRVADRSNSLIACQVSKIESAVSGQAPRTINHYSHEQRVGNA